MAGNDDERKYDVVERLEQLVGLLRAIEQTGGGLGAAGVLLSSSLGSGLFAPGPLESGCGKVQLAEVEPMGASRRIYFDTVGETARRGEGIVYWQGN